MAVKEVLQLGISGADLILSTLKRIKKEKDQFAKKAQTSLTTNEQAQLKAVRQAKSDQRDREELYGKGNKHEIGNKAADIASAASGLNPVAAVGSALTTLGSALGPGGAIAGSIASSLVGAASAFTDKIQSASQTFADTEASRNIAQNYAGKDNGDFLKDTRPDISRNEQRKFIESLGNRFGRFDSATDKFGESVKKFFGTSQQGFDVNQSSQVAAGNFSALGNDKGFFLQKISDSLQGLPPSIQKALQPQLLGMVSDEERMTQYDQGPRSTVTANDDRSRGQAAKLAIGEGNQQNAAIVQNAINSGEAIMVQKMSEMITLLSDLVNFFHGGGLTGNMKEAGKDYARLVIAGATLGGSEVIRYGVKGKTGTQ